MLDVYADLCENVLAMPVVRGAKSARERFAGADDTLTIEAMMQNGEPHQPNPRLHGTPHHFFLTIM